VRVEAGAVAVVAFAAEGRAVAGLGGDVRPVDTTTGPFFSVTECLMGVTPGCAMWTRGLGAGFMVVLVRTPGVTPATPAPGLTVLAGTVMPSRSRELVLPRSLPRRMRKAIMSLALDYVRLSDLNPVADV